MPNHKLFTVKLASYKYAIIYTLKQEHNHMCVLKINLREDVGILSVCVFLCGERPVLCLTGNSCTGATCVILHMRDT